MPDLGNGSVFSQNDANNNTGTMPSWLGTAAPSTLDDAGRALQGAITREWNWRNFTLTAGGTANAKTLTYSVAPAAYYNGQRFSFVANTTNTGAATLNVNVLGAKGIKKDVSGVLTDLAASDMAAGMFVEVAFNTANDCFVWVNQKLATIAAANVTGLGTAATLNVGTAANNVVQLDGSAKLPAVDGSNLTNLPVAGTPSGAVMPYAGASEPSGWLFCFGQNVSRTTYAALFAVLGTTYGAGDGSTTFGLPDLRGRVIAGQDDMGGTSASRLTGQSGGLDGDVLGATGGAETHTLTTAQMPAHTHTVGGNMNPGSVGGLNGATNTSGLSQTTSSTGGGGAHNNVQPTIVLNYIIKT